MNKDRKTDKLKTYTSAPKPNATKKVGKTGAKGYAKGGMVKKDC